MVGLIIQQAHWQRDIFKEQIWNECNGDYVKPLWLSCELYESRVISSSEFRLDGHILPHILLMFFSFVLHKGYNKTEIIS